MNSTEVSSLAAHNTEQALLPQIKSQSFGCGCSDSCRGVDALHCAPCRPQSLANGGKTQRRNINRSASQGLLALRAQHRSSTVLLSVENCCTTGFKIELLNAGACVCLVTVPVIYQPARQRCSLQAELLHVI
jgi:hypothetical protein